MKPTMRFYFILMCLCHCYNYALSGKPRFTSQPSDQSWLISSQDNNLRCSVTGESITKITWMKNNIPIDFERLAPRISESTIVIQDRLKTHVSTLSFVSLLGTDRGLYRCKVFFSQRDSSTVSHIARVTIVGNQPPILVREPYDKQARPDTKSLRMPCEADKGPTEIEWEYSMYSVRGLQHSNSLVKAPSTDGFYLDKLPETKIALERNIKWYKIRCIARNRFGTATSRYGNVTLLIVPTRPVVLLVRAEVHNAFVKWFTRSPSNLKSCDVKWKKDGTNFVSYHRSAASELSVILHNLNWKSRYTVKIRCENMVGFSQWSVPYPFVTKEGIPSKEPGNVAVEYAQNLTTVCWDRIPSTEVNGTLIGYTVHLASDDISRFLNVSSECVEFYNLTSNSNYSLSICGFTSVGCGPFSGNTTLVIPNFRVPPTPIITRIVSEENSASVYFAVSDIDDFPVTQCQANVFYHHILDFLLLSVTTNSLEKVGLINLNSKTNYSVTIYCTNVVGNSMPSFPMAFTTKQTAPTIPAKVQDVKCDLLNNSIAVISWTSLPEEVLFYKVELTPEDGEIISVTAHYPDLMVPVVSGVDYTVIVSACAALDICGPGSDARFALSDYSFPYTSEQFTTTLGDESPTALIYKSDLTRDISIGIAFAIFAVICIGLLAYKRCRTRKMGTGVVHDDRPICHNGNSATIHSTSNAYTPMSGIVSISAASLLKEKLGGVLIEKENLFVGKELGKGEFGVVYQGKLNLIEPNDSSKTAIDVAIKSIKMDYTSFSEKEEFVNEGLRMKELDHPNVMGLIGICLSDFSEFGGTSNDVSPLVVLPFMANGDLRSYLFAIRTSGNSEKLNLVKLLKFSLDIANGMKYLSDRNFVHRDLAARNCMLTQNFKVVVSDFGLSRNLYSESYYRQTHITKLPVKWMAMESLSDNIYTSKTDVWSFGVTLWEILTLCQNPYPGVANHEIYHLLKTGTRLTKPAFCSAEVWHRIVYPCWNPQVKDRISFSQLVNHITDYISSPSEELLEPMQQKSCNESLSNGYEEPISFKLDYNMADEIVENGKTGKLDSLPLLNEPEDSDNSSVVQL